MMLINDYRSKHITIQKVLVLIRLKLLRYKPSDLKLDKMHSSKCGYRLQTDASTLSKNPYQSKIKCETNYIYVFCNFCVSYIFDVLSFLMFGIFVIIVYFCIFEEKFMLVFTVWFLNLLLFLENDFALFLFKHKKFQSTENVLDFNLTQFWVT